MHAETEISGKRYTQWYLLWRYATSIIYVSQGLVAVAMDRYKSDDGAKNLPQIPVAVV